MNGHVHRDVHLPAIDPGDWPCWAEVTGLAQDGDDWGYAWEERVGDGEGGWVAPQPGSPRTSGQCGIAWPVDGHPVLASGTIVRIHRIAQTTGHDRLVAVAPRWHPFMVLLTKDGGSAGSDAATCSFTYTVKSLQEHELATGKTPKRPRLTNVEYEQPSADSPGLAYYDADGNLQLYEAVEEFPKETTCP